MPGCDSMVPVMNMKNAVMSRCVECGLVDHKMEGVRVFIAKRSVEKGVGAGRVAGRGVCVQATSAVWKVALPNGNVLVIGSRLVAVRGNRSLACFVSD